MADLKGKRVAHVSPASNSGDTAPRVLFNAMGIRPGIDYEVLYSGKHDNSIMGVVNKDYDAAPVANNVVDRMRERGMFKKDDIRVVYESRPFPRTAFGVAYDLTPELQAKIRQAFITFDFKKSTLGKEFKDSKAFIAHQLCRRLEDDPRHPEGDRCELHRRRPRQAQAGVARNGRGRSAVQAGAPAAAHLLVVEGLAKVYPTGQRALDGVTS